MANTIENLMLEHLKRFQTTLERIERRLDELTTRQTEPHTAVLGLRRDQGMTLGSPRISSSSSTT